MGNNMGINGIVVKFYDYKDSPNTDPIRIIENLELMSVRIDIDDLLEKRRIREINRSLQQRSI